MSAWWSGLSNTQKEIFILCGLLGIFVVGLTVGIVGACGGAALEVLVHIGFGTALTAFLSALFYFLVKIA